jgi:D-beta-D-heptose 7-phosphate kinase/D-beta-D-heptose 1-phosphate adenosyltransferase
LQPKFEAKLLDRFSQDLSNYDGVLVCDIDKGMLTQHVLGEIIRTTRSQAKPVIIDPRRTDNFSIYRGATALTPNRFETEHATGISLARPENWPYAAKKLIDAFDLNASLVTLDRDGMFIAERSGSAAHIETTAQDVYDVTGAGDVVLAVFGFFWIAGLSAADAAAIANVAASLEVARQGATVISRDELATALRSDRGGSSHKILSLEELRRKVERLRTEGGSVCFTDASFNTFHAHHVRLLESAQAQADVLVVGLQNDPADSTTEKDRARILAALEAVDYVVTFDAPDAAEIARAIRPDVLIVGGEGHSASTACVGDFVRSYGGRVMAASLLSNVADKSVHQNGNGQRQQDH